MSFGIEIYNPGSGKLIVSESYSAYHFMGNATLQSGRQWRINTGVTGRKPIAFVVSGTAYATVEAIFESSTGVWDIYVKASNQASVTRVLVFQTLPSMASAEPWGIQVRRADESIAFDSTRGPLYIRAVHDLSGFYNSFGLGTLTIPSLTTPAIFCASAGVVRAMSYSPPQDVYTEDVLAARVSGTTLQYQFVNVHVDITINAPVSPDLASVDTLEDFVSNAVVTVIDAAIY